MICQFGKYIIVHLICARLCESRVLDGIYKIAGIANLYFMLMTNYQLNCCLLFTNLYLYLLACIIGQSPGSIWIVVVCFSVFAHMFFIPVPIFLQWLKTKCYKLQCNSV